MNINEIITQYKTVATFLEDGEAAGLLDIFASTVESKEYLLPFIGQFSAGKSKLINNILNREILPVKATETTAFLTYIVYSEDDFATIKYTDGEEQNISFDTIKELYQNNLSDSKPIDSLYIGINNELLKNGLKIVDTPGVNTLITDHVKITENLFNSSYYIIYVMGGSPHQTDIEIIKQISALNIRMAFIRTKADMINTNEESFGDAINKDISSLKDALSNDDVHFFAMNNDNRTRNDIQWQSCRERLINFIKVNIAADIATVYEESILARLQILKDKFLNALSQREILIKHSANLTLDELAEQQNRIQFSIDNLNRTIEKNKRDLVKKCETRSEIIESRLKTTVNNEVEKFETEVNILSNNQDISSFIQTQLPRSFNKISKLVSAEVENLSLETASDLKDDISKITAEMSKIKVDINYNFDLETLETVSEEYALMESELQNKINDFEKLKTINESDIEELNEHKAALQRIISQYDQEICEIKSELEETKRNHKPSYVDRPSKLKSKLETVGAILDIASIFIPTQGWANIAQKTGNWITKAKRIKHLGTIGKTITSLSQDLEITARAKAYGWDSMQDDNSRIKTLNNHKKETNLFDYFNISHLLSKLGETIDPPSKEIDIEAEKQFEVLRYNLQQSIDDKYMEKLREVRKMTESDSEVERKRKENELIQRKQEELKQEKESLRKEWEADKKKKMFVEMKRQATDKYRNALNEYREIISARSKDELRNIGENIIYTVNRIVVEQLEAANRQLTTIIADKENNIKNKEEKLIEISSYKNKLQTA